MIFLVELVLFIWLLVLLGLIAKAIDDWAGGPEQRDSQRRNR